MGGQFPEGIGRSIATVQTQTDLLPDFQAKLGYTVRHCFEKNTMCKGEE